MISLRQVFFAFALFTVTAVLIIGSVAAQSESKPSKKFKLSDYVGQYYPCGSQTAKLAKVEKVQIAIDNDALVIKGVKSWDRCRFVEKGNGVYRDTNSIGDLVPGEIKFKDGRSSRKILRADFCYDYFLFVKCASE